MKLKEIRKSKGITQQKLAKELYITQQALCNYEQGKREPDVQMLIKLADYFGVSVDYLVR